MPDHPQSRFDGVVNTLFTVVLVFPAVAMGVVHAWSELVLIVLVALLVLAMILRENSMGRSFRWSWTYLPMVLFLGLVLAQAVPMPMHLIHSISPKSFDAWQTIGGPSVEWGTLSVYPYGTWHDLRLLLVASAMFLASYHYCRSYDETKTILWTITAVGGFVALVFYVQHIAGNGRIYGTINSPLDPSGPFVNYNNYAQFMNQCLGATIALFLVILFQKYRGNRRRRSRQGDDDRGEGPQRVKWRDFVKGPIGILALLILIDAVTIPLSRSRGGTVATAIGALATMGVLAWKERGHQSTRILPGVALACVTFGLIASEPLIFNRYTKLGSDQNTELRIDVIRDSVAMFKASPLVGSGQGSFIYSYPPFQHAATWRVLVNADCDYAELLIETGAIGVASMVLFLGLIFWAVYGRITNRIHTLDVAVYGIGFSLICVVVGSASDFGQRIPANTVMNAVLCGMALALFNGPTSERRGNSELRAGRMSSRSAKAAEGAVPSATTGNPPVQSGTSPVAPIDPLATMPAPVLPRGNGWTKLGWSAAFLLSVAITASLIPGAIRAAIGENFEFSAERMDKDILNHWPADASDHQELIETERQATLADPTNFPARINLLKYQLRALNLVAAGRNETAPWKGDTAKMGLDLMDHTKESRVLAPTSAEPYLIDIQIASQLSDNQKIKSALAAAQQMAPYDLRVNLAAGVAGIVFGETDKAIAAFRVALKCRPKGFPEISNLLIGQLHRPDLALPLASDDPQRLLAVYDGMLALPDDDRRPFEQMIAKIKAQAIAGIQSRIKTRSAEVTVRDVDATKTDAELYARLGELKGDDESMVNYLGRAVSLQYDNVNWHLERAMALARMQRYDEAAEEVRICMILAPGRLDVRAMMNQLGSIPEKQLLPATSPSR